jgi:GNAT superfamily N-acetyltransferase
MASGLRVSEIGVEEAATFEATVLTPMGLPADAGPVIRATAGYPNWHFYLAFDGALPMAGAALFVDGDGAWIGLAATVESHRRRGAQTALLERRLADAAALGCKWVSADTYPDAPDRPNPSYRNMRRAGMTPAYDRTNYLFMTPPPDAPPASGS